MKNFLGYANLVVGSLFFIVGAFAATGLPKAAGRYSVEPEDLVLLLALMGISVVVGAASLLGGLALLRVRAVARVSHSIVAGATLVAGLLLAAVSALGFWSGDPSSIELRILAVPAMLLGASAVMVTRTPPQSPGEG